MDKLTLYPMRSCDVYYLQTIDETSEGFNQKLELWINALESNGSWTREVRLSICNASLAPYKSEAVMRLVGIAVLKCK